jgi:hypothetical protein
MYVIFHINIKYKYKYIYIIGHNYSTGLIDRRLEALNFAFGSVCLSERIKLSKKINTNGLISGSR